jgi:hypothetical protein
VTGEVRFAAGARGFSLVHSVQTDSGSHPASCQMGTGGYFHGVKRSGREADHSSTSSDEVKIGEAIIPLPHKFSWIHA